MAIVNLCGFETGAIGGANEGGSLGTSSVQSTTKRTGTYALQTNPTTTATGYCTLLGIGANGNAATLGLTTTYVRFYFRYGTKPSSNNEEIFQLNHTSVATGNRKIALRINSSGQLMAYASDGTTQIGSTGSTSLAQDTWYRIECSVDSSLTGNVEVRIDGATEISGTGNTNSLVSYGLLLGKVVNRNGNTVDFYYDDVIVGDSGFIGPGGIVRLDPISDNDTWTTGTYADIDDYASQANNDGDTTYTTSSTQNDILEPNFTSFATAGIGSSDTINGVKGLTVCRDETTSLTYHITLRRNGSSGTNTTNLDGGNAYAHRQQTDVGAATGAFSPTDTASLRITRTQSQVRALRCTAMAIMVDYTPATISNDSLFAFDSSFRGIRTELFQQFIKAL
jgi:hypothetical protein